MALIFADPVNNKPYSSFETAAEQVIILKEILSSI
jgi:hypothetical protein